MIRRPLLNATAVEGGGAPSPAPAPASPPPAAPTAGTPTPPPAAPPSLTMGERLRALFTPQALNAQLANENAALRSQVATLTARVAELEPVAAQHREMEQAIAQLEGARKTQSRAVASQVAALGYPNPAEVPATQPSAAADGEQTLEQVQAAIKATKDPRELGRLTALSRKLRLGDPAKN